MIMLSESPWSPCLGYLVASSALSLGAIGALRCPVLRQGTHHACFYLSSQVCAGFFSSSIPDRTNPVTISE